MLLFERLDPECSGVGVAWLAAFTDARGTGSALSLPEGAFSSVADGSADVEASRSPASAALSESAGSVIWLAETSGKPDAEWSSFRLNGGDGGDDGDDGNCCAEGWASAIAGLGSSLFSHHAAPPVPAASAQTKPSATAQFTPPDRDAGAALTCPCQLPSTSVPDFLCSRSCSILLMRLISDIPIPFRCPAAESLRCPATSTAGPGCVPKLCPARPP